MTKTSIKDFYGRIIGYVETDAKGNKTIRDFYNRILGYYYVSDNTTRDFYKRIIAKGDASATFLSKEFK